VFDAGIVFAHLRVPDPMVADFASSPVSSCEVGEVGRIGSVFERFAGMIVGQFGLGLVDGGVGAAHYDQRARSAQTCLDGLYGIYGGGAAVDPPVSAVGLFGVDKKGVV